MPPDYHSQEQVIERQLVDCGINSREFSVKYEDDLQSIEIVIAAQSAVTEQDFACIHEAAGYEIVTFEKPELAVAYSGYVTELVRPQMIADSKARLEEIGLFDGFPKRAEFRSLKDYARALERHAGVDEGSALKVSGDGILFDPPRDLEFQQFSNRYGNLMTCLAYASAIGDFGSFGFIGNEAIAGEGH